MNRFLILIIGSVLIFGTMVQAQESLTTRNRGAIRLYEEARNHYGLGQHNEAIAALQRAIDRDSDFIEAYLVLGDIYNRQREFAKEAEVLKKAVAIDSTFFPTTMFNIGVASFNAGDYAESILWLERYRWYFSDDRSAERVKQWLDRARFAVEASENPYEIELITLGEKVNSDYDEYWPSVTADEQTLVFTVLVPRNPGLFAERSLPRTSMYFQEDFYVSHRGADGQWQTREPLPGSINTDGNEGAQALSADGNWMFFTACGRSDGRGSCDIYFSQRTPEGWSEPVNLGMPVNTPYWESQPTFGADGKTLMFVSNRPGGRGGKDIWQATVQHINRDGVPVFGDVRNLGSNINTTKDENSPFLHHDNRTLYFASEGWPGMGGMDLFVSRKGEDGVWRVPVNLGVPINTPGDEIGLVINARGNRAYFASDGREEDQTSKNIYTFELPPPIQPSPVLYVAGRVYDIETGETLPADFELKDISTGNLIVSTQSNRFSGEFLVVLPVGGQYAFKAEHPGYMFYSGHFDLFGDHPLDAPYQLDIGLQPIRKGVSMTLENIFFGIDSYRLESQSKVELDGLVRFLADNKEVRIMIGGHTDNVGNAAYNQRLSENRARSVYNYIIEQGVDTSRLEYKGFGMDQPIADNETESGRAKNRRTEITIL
ncbi:OmpA family protein [Alkalitalea saponilacus]|uniref:WD40-like Beta Propeller Repeat n=1 Tax=Alkalitalea saponilacus TaxID=889453 RepID=A0A1T5D8X0_9BACT|nr:OmpA family protein [Alkalitalea saponilacus]ASB50622.1 flagellar motor protein MotB [Alkalitalea saponilacus]SKB68056.1 WD40-like Beta Propeller Repeat [Alkalitalea saponilacus]